MNAIRDKEIAIVGGGPGGLTLARLLQMRGADVKVYERDANRNARAQGATLDLHEESGLAALRESGLIGAFEANYRPGADKMCVVDKNGVIIHDDHACNNADRSRPEIDRAPLQNILLDSLLPGTVIWDRQFISLSQQNSIFKLDFKNGGAAFADIVIAADGANSKIRPYITPIKPSYTGYMAVEGVVYQSAVNSPEIHKLLREGKIFAFGDSKSIIVSSKGDGSLVFYASCKTDESRVKGGGINFSDKAQVLAWLKCEYAGWDNIWLELFENSSSTFVPRPLYSMPLDQTWEASPNLTMLGDAAHLMPPFAGEGVNMAMLDALELSCCLGNGDDTLSAIAAYEKQMRRRASEAAEESIQSMIALHSPEAISFMIGVVSQ